EEEPEDDDHYCTDKADLELRYQPEGDDQSERAIEDYAYRHIAFGAKHRNPAGCHPPQVAQARLECAHNRRQRLQKTNYAPGCYSAYAYIEDVAAAYFIRSHLRDEPGCRIERRGEAVSEDLDCGDEYQVGERSACEHYRGDARTNDISDPQ